jgi:hypothetical protein
MFDIFISRIIIKFCKIPKLNEMSAKILDDFSQYLDSHIMPRHPSFLIPVDKGLLVRLNISESLDAFVAVVDSREKLGFIGVRQKVFACVPASVTQIQTPQKGHLLIHDYGFLVVRPHESGQNVTRKN